MNLPDVVHPDPSSTLIRTVGYLAGGLTTLAFVPQVVKSWRTRSTGDLSLLMLMAFTSGVGLWLTYGILLREPPIIANNGITFVLAAILLWIRLRSRGREGVEGTKGMEPRKRQNKI